MSEVIALLDRGGVLMYPLLLLSVLALWIFLERVYHLKRADSKAALLFDEVRILLAEGKHKGAMRLARERPGPVAAVFYALLRTPLTEKADLEEVATIQGRTELQRLTRRLSFLSLIAGLAPLIGLLGTVIGMVKAFQTVATSQGVVNPDINLKAVLPFSATHGLIFRANVFTEDSTVTYSGLTDAGFRMLGPRYNPFKNDGFEIDRYGASVTHELGLGSTQARVLTNLYFSYFQHDWWRQSSTTTDNQCGAAFTAARLAGQRVDPDTRNSIQGRLRNYYTYGITPHLHLDWTAFGQQHEFEAGVRAHFERQDREQVNATSPTGRSGILVEDNLREIQAYFGLRRHGSAAFKTISQTHADPHPYLRAVLEQTRRRRKPWRSSVPHTSRLTATAR